jgi:hypothetical protein
MLGFILMLVFSLGSMAYGFVALFRKDLLWKLRGFSASVEGKGGTKRDEETMEQMNRMGNVMGTIALLLGMIGFIMSLAVMYIYFQMQAGVIAV